MSDDDLPGTLIDSIRAAQARGLARLTLCRVGTSATMWQASTKGHGDGGYHVVIEADPVVAMMRALDRPGSAAPTVSVPSAVAADEDLFA